MSTNSTRHIFSKNVKKLLLLPTALCLFQLLLHYVIHLLHFTIKLIVFHRDTFVLLFLRARLVMPLVLVRDLIVILIPSLIFVLILFLSPILLLTMALAKRGRSLSRDIAVAFMILAACLGFWV